MDQAVIRFLFRRRRTHTKHDLCVWHQHEDKWVSITISTSSDSLVLSSIISLGQEQKCNLSPFLFLSWRDETSCQQELVLSSSYNGLPGGFPWHFPSSHFVYSTSFSVRRRKLAILFNSTNCDSFFAVSILRPLICISFNCKFNLHYNTEFELSTEWFIFKCSRGLSRSQHRLAIARALGRTAFPWVAYRLYATSAARSRLRDRATTTVCVHTDCRSALYGQALPMGLN